MQQLIQSHLPGDHPWQNLIRWYPTTDSTNTQARLLAARGAEDGTVLIAGHQTGGRGRMGRSFHSPADMGIYLSVILRPRYPASELMHLTCAAAVAMCDAVEAVSGVRPGIKWTNDLVFDKRKLGGILTELSLVPGTSEAGYAIIGVGINCCQQPADFPPELRQMATSLSTVTGNPTDRAALAAAMTDRLYRMRTGLFSEKAVILDRYRRDCVTLGKQIRICRGEQTAYGTALDIDENGGLVVRLEDGSVRTVNSGEVSIRGMYGYL